MVTYAPKRADLVWLDFEPQKGREIQKVRPALVLSPIQYNVKSGLALFMPITSQVKGYPFEVLVEVEGVRGAIICDQIRSLDWRARKAKYIATLPQNIFDEALLKLAVLL